MLETAVMSLPAMTNHRQRQTQLLTLRKPHPHKYSLQISFKLNFI